MQREFRIKNDNGLHARPATILVSKANNFKSEMKLIFDELEVDLKSIMGVMSLGISKNSTIIISANGVDEEEALNQIEQVINKLNAN